MKRNRPLPARDQHLAHIRPVDLPQSSSQATRDRTLHIKQHNSILHIHFHISKATLAIIPLAVERPALSLGAFLATRNNTRVALRVPVDIRYLDSRMGANWVLVNRLRRIVDLHHLQHIQMLPQSE